MDTVSTKTATAQTRTGGTSTAHVTWLETHPQRMYAGVNDLLDCLQDERFVARAEARPLIEALEGLDEQVRAAGERTIHADTAEDLGLGVLREAARSDNENIRKIAALALARFGDEPSRRNLAQLLADESPVVRQAAIMTAGVFDDEESVAGVIALLNNSDEEPEVRRTAVLVLGRSRHPAASAALEQAVKDPGPEIRRFAVKALANMEVAEEISSSTETLCNALSDDLPAIRANAADALGKLADFRAADSLSEALADADAVVRNKAAIALARLGDMRGMSALIAQLNEAGPGRPEATEALGNFSDPGAVNALVGALNDHDPSVRLAAVEALHKIGETQAVGVLRARAKGEKEPTVAKAIEAAIAGLESKLQRGPEGEQAQAEPSPDEEQGAGEEGTYRKLNILQVIERAATDLGGEVEETDEGLSLEIPVDQGRRQVVTVCVEEENGTKMARITAICGPADSGNYGNALMLNRGLVYGAVSVKKEPFSETFELSETILARDATVVAVREIISYIASSADRIARQLEGGD